MARRPNILFIVADDLGFADLGCYGGRDATFGKVSPVLDGLAANGSVLFRNEEREFAQKVHLLTIHFVEEGNVRLGVLDTLKDELHRIHCVHRLKHTAKNVDTLKIFLIHQQVFLPRA